MSVILLLITQEYLKLLAWLAWKDEAGAILVEELKQDWQRSWQSHFW
jgi:hypothetical protein